MTLLRTPNRTLRSRLKRGFAPVGGVVKRLTRSQKRFQIKGRKRLKRKYGSIAKLLIRIKTSRAKIGLKAKTARSLGGRRGLLIVKGRKRTKPRT